jgi:hypothetical protein
VTIKALYPTVRPTLNLDFAKTKALDPRITFTRASTATFVGSNGLIQTAASGAARFDHNPTTSESLGLLVEEARTNLQTYSEQLDNAAWTKNNTTVTANATTAPDGTLTADRLLETATTVSFYVANFGGATATPGTYTASVFAKGDGSGRLLNMTLQQSGAYQQSYFNLSTGTVSNVDVSLTASIQALSNGWYRCSVTGTSSSATTLFLYSAVAAGENSVYVTRAGSASAGLFLWGAQLEAGAFPTSYIPTTTATVTRAAEVVDITGGNFSSWFNSSVGTFFTDSTNMPLASNIALSTYNTNNTVAFALGTNAPDGGRAYLPLLGHLSNNTIIAQVFHYNGGGTNFGPTIQNTISNTANINKMAFYTDPPNQLFAVAVAGQIATLDTNFGRTGANSYTLANMMRIGYNGGFYGNYNGRIKRITYYPTRLSNSQLLTLIAT